MRSLRYLNTVLTLIAVLLTLNLWTAWTAGPTDVATSAHAAAPVPMQGTSSPAERQKQMVDELKAVNDSLSDLKATLTSGKVRVKVDSMPGD